MKKKLSRPLPEASEYRDHAYYSMRQGCDDGMRHLLEQLHKSMPVYLSVDQSPPRRLAFAYDPKWEQVEGEPDHCIVLRFGTAKA